MKAQNLPTIKWLPALLLGILAVIIGVEGSLGMDLHREWWFVVLVGITVLDLAYEAVRNLKRGVSFCFSHLGLMFILLGGYAGAPAYREGTLIAVKGEGRSMAISAKGEAVPLPFSVELEDFSIDYYEDGVSPKQFTSSISTGAKVLKISVNHPKIYKGYWIYQSDYDHFFQEYSILKVVRDPMLPLAFIGMILMVISAVLGLKNTWESKAVLPLVAILAFGFAALSLARINFSILVPALRSLWFVPHLIVYMIAYALMAVALAVSFAALINSKIPESFARKLLSTASSLLLIGMICGAIWAKYAWGDYWTWDAKECWAAVTWLFTLMASHIPSRKDGKRKAILFVSILLAFLAMQVTWYGVGYLPASRTSLHTYTK